MDGMNRQSSAGSGLEIRGLPVAAYLTDNEGYITQFNELATELWGRSPQAGERWCGAVKLMDVNGEAIEHKDCSLALTLRSEKTEVHTALLQRPDGEIRAVRPYPSLLRNRDQIVGCLNLLVDVTDDWSLARKLAQRDELLESVLQADAIGLTIFDYQNLTTVRANDCFLNLIGATQDEFENKSIDCFRVTPGEFRFLDDQAVSEARSKGYWAPYEKEYERRDGLRIPVRISSAPIPNLPGHCLVCIEDLTAAKKAQEEVSLLRAEVLHLSRLSAMGTMAAVLAHEVAQPFAAIKNAAWVLDNLSSRSALDIASKDALGLIKREADRGHLLVERMRSFSRPTKDGIEIVDVGLLIDEVSAMALLRCPDVDFSAKVEKGGRYVHGDPVQIQQVILNLLRNAVEAIGGRGTIQIQSKARSSFVEISVFDNGPGFTDDQRERAFRPFSTDKSDGTGLGLSICRSIVESHGGKIEVVDVPIGACLRLTLPRGKAALH